jgi:hypothetical protein
MKREFTAFEQLENTLDKRRYLFYQIQNSTTDLYNGLNNNTNQKVVYLKRIQNLISKIYSSDLDNPKEIRTLMTILNQEIDNVFNYIEDIKIKKTILEHLFEIKAELISMPDSKEKSK